MPKLTAFHTRFAAPQVRQLKRLSRKRGLSIAELIRYAVEAFLVSEAADERFEYLKTVKP